MPVARCEACGGFAPLHHDRHGRFTCPVCEGPTGRRALPGKPLALLLLVVLISAVLAVTYIAATLLAALT